MRTPPIDFMTLNLESAKTWTLACLRNSISLWEAQHNLGVNFEQERDPDKKTVLHISRTLINAMYLESLKDSQQVLNRLFELYGADTP